MVKLVPQEGWEKSFLKHLKSELPQVVTRRPSVIVKERLKGESVCMILLCITVRNLKFGLKLNLKPNIKFWISSGGV